MTPDEAIKELREDREHPTADYTPKLKAAEQLGIEALERLKELRKAHSIVKVCGYVSDLVGLLPSETEVKK